MGDRYKVLRGFNGQDGAPLVEGETVSLDRGFAVRYVASGRLKPVEMREQRDDEGGGLTTTSAAPITTKRGRKK
jgi:hypothetical protein